MSEDLFFDQPEGQEYGVEARKLFLVALREFSEDCEPPQLKAACPFSVNLEVGVRQCNEECMDILGVNNAPPPVVDFPLDNGLTITKKVSPRSRRGPFQSTKPYDAREVYKQDSDSSPLPGWRLASLIYGLKELLGTPPSLEVTERESRNARIEETIYLIESRGINVESYLNNWLRPQVVPPLMVTLRASIDQKEDSGFDNESDWVALFQKGGTKELKSREMGRQVFQTLVTWSVQADLEDLFAWSPPKSCAENFPSKRLLEPLLDRLSVI